MLTRAGPSQRLDLDGAPIALRVRLPDDGIDVFFASRVLSATDGIFRLFLQTTVHRGHPESLDLRGHRISETVFLILCSKSPGYSSLETIVVRRTRRRNTGSQCQLRFVVFTFWPKV